MEKILKNFSTKMIVILGLLVGVLLWVNSPVYTVSAQMPPPPTPTPAPPFPPSPPSTMPISEPMPVDPFPFEPAPPIPFPNGGWCSGEPTEEGMSIAGSVVDPDGNPVANSYVEIYDQSSEMWCHDVSTDENGTFQVYGLTAGTWTLAAQAPWNNAGLQDHFPSPKIEVTVTEDAGTVEMAESLQLSGPQATGQVLMPDGTAASNGSVNLYMPIGDQAECTGFSDEEYMYHSYTYGFTYTEGMFKVGGLAVGTYCVQLMAPWDRGTLGTPAPSLLTISNENSEVIDLGTFQLVEPAKTLAVAVVYAKSDGTTAGLGDINVNVYSEEKGGWADGLTDSDGNYTVQVSGGRWHVSVFPGYESGIPMFQNEIEPQVVTFVDDETAESQTVNFEVQIPTSSVQARIVTPDGEPVPANSDAMEEMGYYGGINININSMGDGWYYASATADDVGEFKLFLPAGEYEMTIYVDTALYPEYYGPAPQTFTLEEDQALDLGDIVLGEIDSFVTGRLVGADGGALPTPSPMDEEYGWYDENYTGISVNAYSDQHSAHREIDASGSFNLPLPPGEYTLEFYLETFLYPDSFAPAPQTIEVVEGESVDLGDIAVQSAQISGIVQTADGDPVGYANYHIYGAAEDCVHEYDKRSFYGTADESGQFSMGGLPAGEYCLMIDAYWGMGGLFAPLPIRFTIEEGAEILDFGAIAYRGPNKTIQGSVLSTNGEGIPNALVNAYLRDGEYGFTEATTDSEGLFTLEVIGGSWDVNIYPGYDEEYPASSKLPWFSENTQRVVTFAQDETEESQNIEFQVQVADATITGRIVAPDGTPLSVDDVMDEMADDMYGYPGYYGHSAMLVNAYSRSGYGNSATVGEDGTFSISVIGGNYEISLYVDEYMYPGYYAPEMLSIRVEDGGAADLGDITLGEKNATIQGQVLTPDGTGIAQISVSAYSDNGWANTMTDEDGAYTMMVRAGDWEVSVQSYMDPRESTGYFLLNTSQQASVAENESATVDFAAAGAAGNILGEIVDSDGLPITDIDLVAYARRVGNMENAAAEDVAVEDNGDEVVAAEVNLSVPAPTPAPIPLPPYPEPFTNGEYGHDYGDGYYYGYDVVAQSMSEQGQFTLAVPSGIYEVGLYLPYNSDYVFAGEVGTSVTESAEQVIQASSRGQVAQANARGEQRVTVSVAPDGTVEDVMVQLVLLRNDAIITGTLLDSNGEAVTDVKGEVHAWMDGPSSSSQSAAIDPETGTYELTVAGGTWYLNYHIDSDAYVNYGGGEALSVEVDPKGSAQQDITLRSLDGVVRGTVTDPEGNPIRWGHVWADIAPSEEEVSEEFFFHGTSAEVINGEFEMQVISGLAYAVNVSGDGAYVQPATQVVIAEADSPATVNLQFRTTDGVISGTLSALVDDVAQPIAAGYIYGWSDDGQYANGEADEDGNFSFEVASGSVWYLGASWWPVGSDVSYHTAEETTVDLTASPNGTADLLLIAQAFPMPPMIAEPFMADEANAYTLEDGTQIEIPAGAIALDSVTEAPSAPIEEAPAAPEPAPPTDVPGPNVPITDEDIVDQPVRDEGEEAVDDGSSEGGGNEVQAQEARINIAPMVEDMPCTVTACPVGYGYNVAVYDNSTGEQIIRNFNENVTMTFHYTDDELAEAKADEDGIAPAYFSSASNTWTRLDNFTMDKESNQIVAEISHPGRWALVTAADVEIRVPTALPTVDEEIEHQVFLPILMK